MNKISPIIIEPGLESVNPTDTRFTVRALIIDQNKLFMSYSKKFDDYMTPGGGVEQNEDFITALKRELLEEMGVVAKTFLPIGYIEEIRSTNQGQVLYQKSHYYEVSIDYITNNKPEAYELRFGMTPVWVDIDEIIRRNEYQIQTRTKIDGLEIHPYSTLIRENTVLKYIKEVKKL